jgi:hypothetical protein
VPRIFISYQQDQNELIIGRIKHRLIEEFGFQQVLDKVPMTKANYDASLADAFNSIDFVVAVITPQWRKEVMNNEDHPMYQELRVALRKDNLKVLPVLVDGATMPEATEYPQNLRRLHYRNPYPLRPGSQFVHDMDRLMRRLQGIDQTQTMSAIPESKGCIYRSQVYIIAGILLFLMIIGLILSSFAQVNPLDWVEERLSGIQATEIPNAIPPLEEEAVLVTNSLELMSEGGFVRAEPQAEGTLLYRARAGERLNAILQTRTTHQDFPTWLLVELPDNPGFYGWIWIGVFEPEAQEIGFGLPIYDDIRDAETRYPIGQP